MKKIVLAIMDGVGYREEIKGNAFKQANKPNFDYILNEYPHSFLDASGVSVGLPEGQMGNSEVGHLNIGAGRIVDQPLKIINDSIKDNSFFQNNILINAMKNSNNKLHIIGLLSDGGVHSHINHIISLLRLAKLNNISNIYFHIITDGRDTLPNSAYNYIKELEDKIIEYGIGKIATVSGRYYAMDRDNNIDRTKKAYDAMVNGVGKRYENCSIAINDSYNNSVTDEFTRPCIIDDSGLIEDNDNIIWANFRSDRAVQILSMIVKEKKINLVTMMPLSEDIISNHAFNSPDLNNTFGEYLSKNRIKQLRIAETEKYEHVTYFFDGGENRELELCDKILIPSSKVATYDMKPEMSCNEITSKLIEVIDNYQVVILNYANGDMVGHTGNLDAAIKGIETIDYNLGLLYKKVKEIDATLIITADHGNCEYMLDEDNNIITSHTSNKVYFIICDNKYKLNDGKLANIAPTILNIMDMEVPIEMTEKSLIQ